MHILAIHDRFHGLDIKYKVEVPFASVHAPIHLDENTYDIRLSRRDPPGPILHEFRAHHQKVRLEDVFGGTVHKYEHYSKDKGDYEKWDFEGKKFLISILGVIQAKVASTKITMRNTTIMVITAIIMANLMTMTAPRRMGMIMKDQIIMALILEIITRTIMKNG
jgi:hypothetical protein